MNGRLLLRKAVNAFKRSTIFVAIAMIIGLGASVAAAQAPDSVEISSIAVSGSVCDGDAKVTADIIYTGSDLDWVELTLKNPSGTEPVDGSLTVNADAFTLDETTNSSTAQVSFDLAKGSAAGTWTIEAEAIEYVVEDDIEYPFTLATASQTFEVTVDGDCQDVDPPVINLTAAAIDTFLNDCKALGGANVTVDVEDDGGIDTVVIALLDSSGTEVDSSHSARVGASTYEFSGELSVPETGEPGTYTVVVTASDVNGNEVSQTESVTISEVETPLCPSVSISNVEADSDCTEEGAVRFDLTATNFLNEGDEILVRLEETFGRNPKSSTVTLLPADINPTGPTKVTVPFPPEPTTYDYALVIFAQAGGTFETIEEAVNVGSCPTPSATPVPQPTATTTTIVVTVPTATPSFVWDGEPSHDKAPVASVTTPSTPDTPKKEPASAAPTPQAPKKVDDPAPKASASPAPKKEAPAAGGGLAMTGSTAATLALAGFLIVLAGFAFRSGGKQLKGQP